MSFSLTVLCLNGRRETVKATPNSSVLQVLEEACQKQKLKAEEFDLYHYNRCLDLSLPIRFSNIPNRSQLELRAAKYVRRDASVTVCLQLESGERPTADFSPCTTVHEVVQVCLSQESILIPDMDEVVCFYMRQKISGSALNTTTLKSLGLTQGKAVLRLFFEKPEALGHQAHISGTLHSTHDQNAKDISSPSLSSAPEDKTRQSPLTKKKSFGIKNTNSSENKDFNISPRGSESFSQISYATVNKPLTEEPMAVDESEIQQSPEKQSDVLIENSSNQNYKNEKMISENDPYTTMCADMEEEIGEVNYVGDRHAVVYSLDDVSETIKADLPDEFFDVTLEDVKYMMADYVRQREELENQQLLTREQRESRMVQKFARYSQTVIRIYFPERIVLQATFKVTETVQDILDFLRSFMEDQNLEYYLYVTPPKEGLNPSKILLEAALVPAAVVYFGCNIQKSKYLMAGLQLSDPRAAAKAAAESRSVDSPDAHCDNVAPLAAIMVGSQSVVDTFSNNSTRPAVRKSENAPKWFKIGKK